MRSKLTTIILIGMVLGILVGYACHILWPVLAGTSHSSNQIRPLNVE